MIIVDNLHELTFKGSGVIIYKDKEGIEFNGYVLDWIEISGNPIGLGVKLTFEKITSKCPEHIKEIALQLAEKEHERNEIDDLPIIDQIYEDENCYVFTFTEWY